MNANQLIRLSGLAAIAGGVFTILARVLQILLFGSQPLSVHASDARFFIALGLPGLLGSFGFLVCVIGLYARQADRAGWTGMLIFVIAFGGVSLSLGANWAYAFAAPYLARTDPSLLDLDFGDPRWGLFGSGFLASYLAGAIGWLLLGISTWWSRALPAWVGITMIVSLLLAGFAPLETSAPSGIILNVLLSAGPMAAGYALWRDPG